MLTNSNISLPSIVRTDVLPQVLRPGRPDSLVAAELRLHQAAAALAWAEDVSRRRPRLLRDQDVLSACDELLRARAGFYRLLAARGLTATPSSSRFASDELIADLRTGAMA